MEETHGDLFVIRQSAVGFGAFALRDISCHTLILTEEPILTSEQVTNATKLHEDEIHQCQADDIKYLAETCKLSTEKMDRLWQMHDQYIDNDGRGEKRLWGIIKSNAFYSTDKKFAPGVYPTAARLNHSCSPNVGYDFNGWTMRMYTSRGVKAGEELTDCYSDVVYHNASTERYIFLKMRYGFDCACKACNITDDDRRMAGDERRERLKDIAIGLGEKLGAHFLYSAKFDEDVQTCIDTFCGLLDENDEGSANAITLESTHHRPLANSNQTNIKPNRIDLDLLIEYIELSREEGLLHDALPLFELTYDVARFLGETDCIREFGLGDTCLKLLEVSKGEKHKMTRKFRAKLNKS